MAYSKEYSTMSLSSIAEALEQIDAPTPRKLVDHIIEAKKRKKKMSENNCLASQDTYTVVSGKSSIPATPAVQHEKSERFFHEEPEKDVTLNKSFESLHPKLKELLTMKIDDTFSASPRSTLNKATNIDEAQNKFFNESRKSSLQAIRDNNNMIRNSLLNQSRFVNDGGYSSLTDPSNPSILKQDSTLKDDTLTNSPGSRRLSDKSNLKYYFDCLVLFRKCLMLLFRRRKNKWKYAGGLQLLSWNSKRRGSGVNKF